MLPKTVLILTNSYDTHTHVVVPEIEKNGGKVIRIDFDRLNKHFPISIDYQSGNPIVKIDTPVGKVDPKEIVSIWIRRPYTVFQKVENLEQKLIEGQMSYIIKALKELLNPSALVVNDPFYNSFATNKLIQLKKAKSLGLLIPETLVTNSEKEAKVFYLCHHKKLIAKSLGNAYVTFDGKIKSLMTHEITRVSQLNYVKNCPTLLQEKIIKKKELRITMIGHKIFTVGFESHLIPSAETDFRENMDQILNLPHTIEKLPSEIEKKLIFLLKEYHLQV